MVTAPKRSTVCAFLLLSALLAVGCGVGRGPVDRVDEGPPAGWLMPGSAVPNLVVVPENGAFDQDMHVECGGPPSFKAGALVNPELLAESSTATGALESLDDFLASGEGDWWPQDGYWVLDNEDDSLLVAHLDDQGTVTMMGTERVDSGWMPNRISAGDSCSLRVPLPDGLGEVAWRLDPSYPADPEGLEIRLLATGRACSGGQPMDDRLSEPQILEQQDKIYLALVAFLPTGAQTCPGNPEEAVVITLSQPVGTRSVVDARTAAGTISDHLPISPCGHIDEAELPTPRPTDGPIALDGPPRRTICG